MSRPSTIGDVRSVPVPMALALALAVAMSVSVFAIPAVGVLAPFLIEDFALSRSALGWLVTGIAFVTAVSAPVTGRLADHVGGRRVLLGLVLATMTAAALMAVAPSYLWLCVFAALAGVPNGANNPATNKLIIAHVPAGRRGLVMGIKQSGVQGGIALVSLVLPAAALIGGWRVAVAGVAAACLVAAVVVRALVPQDQPVPVARGGRPRLGRVPPRVGWLVAYSLLMGAGGATITSFLPLFAHESLEFSPALAGVAASLVGFIGVGARILIGHVVEFHGQFAGPLAVIAGGAALVAGALLVADLTSADWLIWPAVVVAGLTVASWTVVTMLAAVQVGPDADAGHATGFVVLGFMGGYMTSPVIFGATVDRVGGYAVGWAAVAGVFGLAGLLMLLWRASVRRAGFSTPSAGNP